MSLSSPDSCWRGEAEGLVKYAEEPQEIPASPRANHEPRTQGNVQENFKPDPEGGRGRKAMNSRPV